MPAKVNDYWIVQVRHLKAEHPDWGAPRLTDALVSRAATISGQVAAMRDAGQQPPADLLLLGDVPSERWVSQWLRREWPKVEPADRRQYMFVHWPGSFESGALRWEEAATTIELLRERRRLAEYRLGEWRPLVKLARWFHRITVAAPGLDFERRHLLAFAMTGYESGLLNRPDMPVEVEAWLSFWDEPDKYAAVARQTLIDLDELLPMLDMGLEQEAEGYFGQTG